MTGRAKIICIIALISILVSIASIYLYDRFIIQRREKSLDEPGPQSDESQKTTGDPDGPQSK